ncbi:TIM23 complex component [Thoreauomyces humboldtii]|nr:TIM23 complex component [Thoreauomyces humboldtii]
MTTASPARNPISWHDYFALRKSRKNWERAGAVFGGTTGFVGGSYYFGAVAEFDPTRQLFGISDPVVGYVLATLAVGAGCGVTGLVGAGQIWRLTAKKGTMAGLDARDREFFHRIQRYRPKEIAAAVPVPTGRGAMPDYYGEKINSVADYKEWLKKQRQFIVSRSKGKNPYNNATGTDSSGSPTF